MEPTHYFVRQKGHHVSGPYRVEQLRELIRKGRLRPDMEFSHDGKDWAYGLELMHLFPSEWRSRKIATWYAPAKWAGALRRPTPSRDHGSRMIATA